MCVCVSLLDQWNQWNLCNMDTLGRTFTKCLVTSSVHINRFQCTLIPSLLYSYPLHLSSLQLKCHLCSLTSCLVSSIVVSSSGSVSSLSSSIAVSSCCSFFSFCLASSFLLAATLSDLFEQLFVQQCVIQDNTLVLPEAIEVGITVA